MLVNGVAPSNDSTLYQTFAGGGTWANNGALSSVFTARYAVSNASPAVITLTVTAASSTYPFELVFMGHPAPSTPDIYGSLGYAAPRVILQGVPYLATDSATPTDPVNETNGSAFDSAVAAVATELAGDGMIVGYANSRANEFVLSDTMPFVYNLPNGTSCPATTSFPWHPNNCGHSHLADAALKVLQNWTQQPQGAAGGDLSGTYPNPTVARLNGGTVAPYSNVVGTDSNGRIVPSNTFINVGGAALYFGTPDAQPIYIRTNSTNRALFDQNGAFWYFTDNSLDFGNSPGIYGLGRPKDIYAGTSIGSGSSTNADLIGSLALSSGVATYTLTGSYSSPPTCFCKDVTTRTNSCSVTESTTTLTFAGTGTDTVRWICMRQN